MQRADEQHPELGAGLLEDRPLRLRPRGQDRLGGADHGGDDQVREHPQVLGRPVVRVGEPGEVRGELALDELDLVADGRPHGLRTGDPLAEDEREVVVLGVHVLAEHLHRAVDDVLVGGVAAAYVAQHLAQRSEGLLDQGQAEILDRVEVPVEGGRHDADLLGDLAQGQRDQAAVGAQVERRIENRSASALLALHPGLDRGHRQGGAPAGPGAAHGPLHTHEPNAHAPLVNVRAPEARLGRGSLQPADERRWWASRWFALTLGAGATILLSEHMFTQS